jgi:hypothetical protein
MKAHGILRHHFHGTYSATVGLQFADAPAAREAIEILGEPWELAGERSLVVGVDSAGLKRLKRQLRGHGLRTLHRDRGGPRKGPGKDAIDCCCRSVDVGCPFTVEVRRVAPSVPRGTTRRAVQATLPGLS